MGTLFGFFVGYVLGARAGSEGFDKVAQAFTEIRRSDEMRAFVGILRDHIRGTAATVSERLAAVEASAESTAERLAAARRRAAGPAEA